MAPISERLLQFLWQHQYFNTKELTTASEESLQILASGQLNLNQGPDFFNAKIKIGDIVFAGSVETHVFTSDWSKHKHQSDPNYSNVILHVVWINDTSVSNKGQVKLPVLELQPLVSTILLDHYQRLMNKVEFIPCNSYLPLLSDVSWMAWKERLCVERLEERSKNIIVLLKLTNNHWEEVFWWMLARNFGLTANTDLFFEMAKSVSITILAKHKQQILQLESILLGQCNLLNDSLQDDYYIRLQKEYAFLKKKYQFNPVTIQPAFLRMRPASFPTIRLAQLAMLIHQSTHLFSIILEIKEVKEIAKMLEVIPGSYWNQHYTFKQTSNLKQKQLGVKMIENIIINTIVPVVFSYGLFNKHEDIKDKALQWLMQLPPEENNIINTYKSYNVSISNALETQAILQLKKQYCTVKRCLECTVGHQILKVNQ